MGVRSSSVATVPTMETLWSANPHPLGRTATP